MKTIKDVLAQKGSDVVSIYEDQTVYDAIKLKWSGSSASGIF
jgi:hypothetical protein